MANSPSGDFMVFKNIAFKIVIINVLIFILWYVYGMRNPEFMIKNFLVSWTAVSDGRFWTLLTSVFSHNMLMHLFINMFVLYNFGMIIEQVLGSKRFLIFFLIAGICGSSLHCLVSEYVLQQPNISALGASGAVSGIVLLFALLFPKEKIFIFGLIPVPAIWAAVAFTGIDVWGLISQTQGSGAPIGYGAHLGGALAGLLYFGVLRFQSPQRINL
jgi:membrane associated rhomboid family serine protease